MPTTEQTFSPLAQKVGAAEHRNERHDCTRSGDDGGVRVLGADVGHAPDGFSLHVYRFAAHDKLEVLQHACCVGAGAPTNAEDTNA